MDMHGSKEDNSLGLSVVICSLKMGLYYSYFVTSTFFHNTWQILFQINWYRFHVFFLVAAEEPVDLQTHLCTSEVRKKLLAPGPRVQNP